MITEVFSITLFGGGVFLTCQFLLSMIFGGGVFLTCQFFTSQGRFVEGQAHFQRNSMIEIHTYLVRVTIIKQIVLILTEKNFSVL
jgi:hypothetical protein